MDPRAWARGNAGKLAYIKSISIVLAILLGGIFAAALLYERPFSFLTVQISQLADLGDNPVGGVLFAACLIVAGVLILPHAMYLYRVMLPDVKIAGGISAFFIGASGIGISIVGIFPSDVNYAMHIVGAILAFGGIALGAIFSLPPLLKKLWRGAGWPKPWQVLVTYGQLAVAVVVTIFLVGIPLAGDLAAGTFSSANPPTWWAPCEWMLLFSAVAWAILLVYMAPRQRQTGPNPRKDN